jgi:hypothetical protein
MDASLFFSILAASFSIGGILIAVGVIKGKINQADEVNKVQAAQLEKCASKADIGAAAARADEQLMAAIKRSDEMLELMRRRAEEDRASGEGHYKELYGILSDHGERIKAVETTQKTIDKTLEEIKSDIKTGFSEIKIELKELRKQ